MALGADALTTVDKAELYLDRTGGSGVNEQYDYDFLELLVGSLSTAVQRYTGRQFMPSETGVAKTFRYDGGGYLSLEPYEARAVTSIVLYSDLPTSAQVTLATQSSTQQADYRLEPRAKTIVGTYLWIALPVFDASWQWGPTGGNARVNADTTERQVTVTGDWGVGSVPADVELATLIAVAHLYRNWSDFGTAQMGADQFSEPPEVEPFALPRASRALLTPYRR